MPKMLGKTAMTPEEFRQLTDGSQKQQQQATQAELRALAATAKSQRTGRVKHARLVAAVLALRLEGFNVPQTADILGVSIGTVRVTLREARKDATIDSQLDRLDKVAVPLAVDNVIHGIEAGDKDYTRDVLTGRGVFRSFKSSEVQVRRTTLELKVITVAPAGGGVLPAVRPGAIVGTPETLALPPARDHAE
jgi:Sigma-70, region 4